MSSLKPNPFNHKPYLLVTVIGPIGSGKTTVSQILANQLKLPLLNADPYEDNPFLPDYIKDQARWAFATELFFTLERIKKLGALTRLLQQSSVIVDSGLIMSQIYMKNHLVCGTITPAEWQFYQEIVADYQTQLPNPDIIIYLTAKPISQLARIRARGRDFEAGYTLEYLTQITDRLNEYISGIQRPKPARHAPARNCCIAAGGSQGDAGGSKIQLVTVNTDQENLLEKAAQQKLIASLKTHLTH